jgi:transcriptional regulator with XRE-family HTH domain
MSTHPLERLVQQDTFGELLALLEPEELVIAALRLEGLSDAHIGELLGLSRAAVSRRMERARKRAIRALPELATVLRDRGQPRQKPPGSNAPPLEQGWLCRWPAEGAQPGHAPPAAEALPPEAGLTTRDVAQRFGVAPQTVTRWIRAGWFPHACRAAGRRGDYRIPEEDLASSQLSSASRPSR